MTAGSLSADDGELDRATAAFARVGAAWSPSFSPDGRRIAFLSRLSGTPQVWIVPTEGGWPEQITAMDDPIGAVNWSPDGSWLAFSAAPGGGLNTQVYLARPDGSGARRITEGGEEGTQISGWSRDGALLMLSSNRRTPAARDAYTYDVAAGKLTLVAENPGLGEIADLSRDGRRAVIARVKSRSDSNLYLKDLPGGGETLLTPHEGPGNFGGGVFSADGATIYLSSDKDRDRIAMARVALDKAGRPGAIETLEAREDADLEDFDITEDGATAALLWNVAGRSELQWLDLSSLKTTPGPALPSEVASALEFSRDGKMLALTVGGAAAPRDVWVIAADGAPRQVTRSPHPGIDLASLVRPELVSFPAHDGLTLTGWLYRPRGVHGAADGPGPAVLSFHGGPEGQERPIFRDVYQALLSRGIAVLAPNVRGSAGFGKRFVNLDNGPLRADGVRDIKACRDYLVKAGVADPKRIGIMGGSYGGYMVMAGLTEYPDLFAAGADLYGVVNFETFFKHTQPWMAAISTIEYGDPATQAAMLRDLSPIHKVDRVKAPTLVLHGAHDTNVPVVEAEQVVENLKRRGVPVEYILFPDEGHGWTRTPNQIRSTVEIVKWFGTYLK